MGMMKNSADQSTETMGNRKKGRRLIIVSLGAIPKIRESFFYPLMMMVEIRNWLRLGRLKHTEKAELFTFGSEEKKKVDVVAVTAAVTSIVKSFPSRNTKFLSLLARGGFHNGCHLVVG